MNNVFTPTRPRHSRTHLAVNSSTIVSIRIGLPSAEGLLRHPDLLDRLRDSLASPLLNLDLSKLGDDLLSQFLLSAWHWLPPLVGTTPKILSLDVMPFKGGAGQNHGGEIRIGVSPLGGAEFRMVFPAASSTEGG
jgi:hypothetical protein